MGEAVPERRKTPRREPRKAERPARPSRGDAPACPIVGVGASAGGLEAFTRLLRALPPRLGMALVLVQHLDPTHESLLAVILGRESAMPVTDAADGMLLERDHVYVMPPGVSMTVSGGAIKLVGRPKTPALVLPIDSFLRSISEECAALSIGVVLSGTGTDGVQGLTAIKETGGLTFAQDPTSAEYDGMPRAAIEAGVVDAVLDPQQIAAELVRLGEHPQLRGKARPEDAAQEVDEESLGIIVGLVRERAGLDLSNYRRTTLSRRIARRVLLLGVDTVKEYVQLLRERPAEVEALYRDVLVNVTAFFRDPDVLEALTREVFPDIVERAGAEGTVRMWVPGCSKGQEAYSILISLVEFLDGRTRRPRIQMFATDVNERDIEVARAGIYPESIAHEVSPERLERFFTQQPGGYQIEPSIREMCVFAVHDVTKDPPFSRLDLVSFRNVLIYMERPLQKRVLQILHYALDPGGFLLLGSAEAVGTEQALFTEVDKKRRLYRRKPGPARLLPLPPTAGAIGFARKGGGERPQSSFDVLQEADRIVRGGYQPTGVVIDADLEVLQIRGHLAPYLDPAEGTPDLKLSRLLSPQLFPVVEEVVREAGESGAPAKRRAGIRLPWDAAITAPTGERYYLVMFQDRPRATGGSAEKTAARGTAKTSEPPDTAALRHELDETRRQLEAIISEKDAANTDLRTASERLQTGNEELRTINEEFQTAQEELQSTNEELTTLNDELRNRNAELGRLNDDLSNVIEGVEIPILILDIELRIRRFTPHVGAIVSIVPADIGRPIVDLRFKVDVPDFGVRVDEVLAQGVPTESEVRSAEGHWYSMRVRPYRTSEGRIDGVVIAFLDIDALKRLSEDADRARERAETVAEELRAASQKTSGILESISDAFFTLDRGFSFTYVNQRATEMIGRSRDELLGNVIWDVFPEAIGTEFDEQYHVAMEERLTVRFEAFYPPLHAWYEVRAYPSADGISVYFTDVSERRRERELSEALDRIDTAISSTLEPDEILDRVMEEAAGVISVDRYGSIVQRLPDGGWEITQVAEGKWPFAARLSERGARIADMVEAAHQPVIVGDARSDPELADLDGGDPEMRSIIAFPLVVRGEVFGVLNFTSAELRTFIEAEVDFGKKLAADVSLALTNARLYQGEHDIAERLQNALLALPERIEGVDFARLYRSSTEAARVGGDFYDLFPIGHEHVGITVGDMSGHGVEAAVLTSLVKNAIRVQATQEDKAPNEVVASASAVLYENSGAEVFATVFFGVLDLRDGRLDYCSAGHPTGARICAGGGVDRLPANSPMMGAFLGQSFEVSTRHMDEGDVLFLYTDGLTEARNGRELYGEERLFDLLATERGGRPDVTLNKVIDDVFAYSGGRLSDDVAILSVRKGELDG